MVQHEEKKKSRAYPSASHSGSWCEQPLQTTRPSDKDLLASDYRGFSGLECERTKRKQNQRWCLGSKNTSHRRKPRWRLSRMFFLRDWKDAPWKKTLAISNIELLTKKTKKTFWILIFSKQGLRRFLAYFRYPQKYWVVFTAWLSITDWPRREKGTSTSCHCKPRQLLISIGVLSFFVSFPSLIPYLQSGATVPGSPLGALAPPSTRSNPLPKRRAREAFRICKWRDYNVDS